MEIVNIAPSVLKVHPKNQEFFDDIQGEEYNRFKGSVEMEGILEALLVAPDMTVISGHQRLRAAVELGFSTVPVVVRDDVQTDEDKTRILLVANFSREKNDPIKQAKVYKEYAELRGVGGRGGDRKSKADSRPLITQEDIAKELGVSVSQLKDIKRLTYLDTDLQELISSGKVSARTGYKVISKLSIEEQARLFESLPKDVKLSQREVQEYVDEIKEELEFVNGDLEDVQKNLAAAKKEVEEANKLAEAYKQKLEDKERDIAGEMIMEADKAKLAARESAEKYFKYKDASERAQAKLDVALKKIAQYESGEIKGIVPADTVTEIADLRAKITIQEKEMSEMREQAVNHTAHDIDDFFRFMENACKVINVYATSSSMFDVVLSMPEVKHRLEENARTLKEASEKILDLVSGKEFSEFD
jgi:ParB family transcriptional regulator, chromosome partitioning protein